MFVYIAHHLPIYAIATTVTCLCHTIVILTAVVSVVYVNVWLNGIISGYADERMFIQDTLLRA